MPRQSAVAADWLHGTLHRCRSRPSSSSQVQIVRRCCLADIRKGWAVAAAAILLWSWPARPGEHSACQVVPTDGQLASIMPRPSDGACNARPHAKLSFTETQFSERTPLGRHRSAAKPQTTLNPVTLPDRASTYRSARPPPPRRIAARRDLLATSSR